MNDDPKKRWESPRPILPLGTALLAVIGAASWEYLVPNAAAQVLRRRDDHNEDEPSLLLVPSASDGWAFAGHKSHSSHKSHASHKSHYSGSGGGGGGGGGGGSWSPPVAPEPYVPPPPPPKPATVSFVAFPGGRIFIDGKPVGRDSTGTMTLPAGYYNVRIENRFIGDGTLSVGLSEGQTGVVVLKW